MHSATEAALRKLDLIDFIPDSQGEAQIRTFQGRRVIVDDGWPRAARQPRERQNRPKSGMAHEGKKRQNACEQRTI